MHSECLAPLPYACDASRFRTVSIGVPPTSRRLFALRLDALARRPAVAASTYLSVFPRPSSSVGQACDFRGDSEAVGSHSLACRARCARRCGSGNEAPSRLCGDRRRARDRHPLGNAHSRIRLRRISAPRSRRRSGVRGRYGYGHGAGLRRAPVRRASGAEGGPFRRIVGSSEARQEAEAAYSRGSRERRSRASLADRPKRPEASRMTPKMRAFFGHSWRRFCPISGVNRIPAKASGRPLQVSCRHRVETARRDSRQQLSVSQGSLLVELPNAANSHRTVRPWPRRRGRSRCVSTGPRRAEPRARTAARSALDGVEE